MTKNKILIIEDDPNIADLITIHLKDLDMEAEWAADGEAGLTRASEGNHALIILDLMLPKLWGYK